MLAAGTFRVMLQRYFSGLSKNTFLLAFASLFADISTEMLYPVLPIFLTQTLNASGQRQHDVPATEHKRSCIESRYRFPIR
jgi:hypothetical protein